ncbi:metal-dependent hydrolase [Halorubrum sp. CBA1125]|uniref:metal-dependent hydrolase n=1 Tax=Halorubrum sp. CBA1125 TaxID=2668072 RepID=UPI001E56573F|nr:metal-dependent hydrolase [Halorubrum sp. CBA1125]
MLLVASVFAVTGLAIGVSSSRAITGVLLALFGALIGVTMIGAHILADALTPMGIRPFKPLRNDTYTLEITKAANPITNYALLVVGGVLAGVAFITGSALAV